MPDLDFLKTLIIEPLDPKKHDRAAFSCQEARINTFLKQSARQQSAQDHTKAYVAVSNDADGKAPIIGFYAINTHSIDVSALPEGQCRGLPYPIASGIYISAVGVTEEHQGKGLGTFLMGDVFKRCVSVADIVGSHFVILDALNADAFRLYERLRFTSIPRNPDRMIQTMKMIRAALRKAAKGG